MFYVGRLARQREREQTEFRDSHELFMVLTIHTNAPTTAPRCGRWRWMLLAMMMLFAQTVARWDPELRANSAVRVPAGVPFLEGCGAGLVQRWVQRYAARSDSR